MIKLLTDNVSGLIMLHDLLFILHKKEKTVDNLKSYNL